MMIAAAAADSSAIPGARRTSVRVLMSLGLLMCSACNLSLPSGVFSCADGQRCPRGQVCGDDNLCLTDPAQTSSRSSDADSAQSDARQALADAGKQLSEADGDAGDGEAGAAGSAAGAAATAPEPFTVSSAQPALHGVLEDLASGVHVTFSAAVDPASLGAESVRLLRDGQPVAGTLEVSHAALTFTPDAPWTLAAQYELRLTDSIVDTSNHALTAFTLRFSTRDGRWLRERRFDGAGPSIALAGDGFGVLAWSQPAASESYPEMWSAQFTPPSTWSTPLQIKNGASGAFLSQVVADQRHHAAVAWASISSNLSTTAYTSGPSWGPDAYIAKTARHERMLVNANDELMIVADAIAGGAYGIVGAHFTLGEVSPARVAVGGSGGNNTKPGIALLDGEPHVIWQHAASGDTNAPTQIMAGGLSTAPGTPLSSEGVPAANAVIAGDRYSAAIGAWEQSDPNWTNIWASRLVSGGSWSAPVRLSDNAGSALDVRLALDAAGRAVALWKQAGNVVSTHFSPNDGWSAPQRISAPDALNIGTPELAVDAAGNAIAVWTQAGQNAGLNEVWVARYLRDSGWPESGRVRVSDLEAGTGDIVDVSVDDSGRAFVIWVQENAVWSARFD